ncbi:MAG: hypothetical protein CME65_12905 [Halobacteriovoraceae bacterium]|nr:hypothetical protein [Halobacteriovoraceae bacterium]
MMSKNFRTYELAMDFYKECRKIKLNGAMKNQFERASLSIVLNLSEGSGKPTRKDRARFYFIAYGSLKETCSQSGRNLIPSQNLRPTSYHLEISLFLISRFLKILLILL